MTSLSDSMCTADNQTTIIGERSIGDEYFDAAEGLVFVISMCFLSNRYFLVFRPAS